MASSDCFINYLKRMLWLPVILIPELSRINSPCFLSKLTTVFVNDGCFIRFRAYSEIPDDERSFFLENSALIICLRCFP